MTFKVVMTLKNETSKAGRAFGQRPHPNKVRVFLYEGKG